MVDFHNKRSNKLLKHLTIESNLECINNPIEIIKYFIDFISSNPHNMTECYSLKIKHAFSESKMIKIGNKTVSYLVISTIFTCR